MLYFISFFLNLVIIGLIIYFYRKEKERSLALLDLIENFMYMFKETSDEIQKRLESIRRENESKSNV